MEIKNPAPLAVVWGFDLFEVRKSTGFSVTELIF